MVNVYVHRIEITQWPTDDGLPWARFYGPGTASPNHLVPSWLQALIDEARPHQWRFAVNRGPLDRIADRIRWDDDRDEFIGVLMPQPKRRNYLSASGVSELAADMRAFGAEVVVQRSEPVRWN